MTLLTGDEEIRLTLGERPGGGKWRFFCVDDSEFVLKSLERNLHSLDGEILAMAHDGEEAVARFPEIADQVDLVTLDITMPKMNGLEALKRLLAINPQVKVVMVSALGHEQAVKTAILLGAKHFILKPFHRANLHQVFRSLLAGGGGVK